MKTTSIFLFFLLTICSAAFSQETNPLIGGWELISGVYNLPDNPTERSQPDRPYQLKVFSPGHFAYVHLKPDGSFNHASAGTYRLEGNKYIETHNWHSSGQFAGVTATFEFRIEGDLLYMKSILPVVDAEGKVLEQFKMMEDVRRRAQ